MNDVRYRFADVTVDVAGREVRRGGARVDLEPKAFDVLVQLLAEAGRVVDKRQLLAQVWSDVHVTDSSLARAVTHVRRAVGDDPKAPRFVETVPTRGYRFVGDVTVESRPEPPASTAIGAGGSPPRLWVPVGSAVAVALGIALLWALASSATRGSADGGLLGVGPLLARAATHDAVQLTTSRGLDLDPAFSPDGTRLAYASDRSGAFEIEVRSRVAASDARVLTSNGGDNVQPAWSPDGLWLAYHSRRDGGIWVMPSSGGSARQVVPEGSSPAWAPDGRTIAFQTAGQPDIMGGPGGARSTIASVDVASGRVVAVTTPGRPRGSHGQPVWLPSGTAIAFSVIRVPTAEVWQTTLEGDVSRIAPCANGCRSFVVRRGPSEYLGFVDTWPRPLLQIVRLEGGRVPREAVVASTDLPTSLVLKNLALAPDLTHLAYASSTRTSEIWEVGLEGGEPARPAAPRALVDERRHRYGDPVVAPDGLTLAYTAMRAGDAPEAWLLDLRTRTPRYLGAGLGQIKGWSADGRALLLMGHDGPIVQRVELTTGRRRPLLAFPEWAKRPDGAQRIFTLRVSPDFSRYYYTAEGDDGLALWVGDVGRPGSERRLAGGVQHDASFGAWSTDGTRVAYQRANGWRTSLVVQEAEPGRPVRTLAADVEQAWVNDWSPDDRFVVMAALRRGRWAIEAVDVASGRVHALTPASAAADYVRWPTWSPRGDRVVYEQGRRSGNIWLAPLEPTGLRDES